MKEEAIKIFTMEEAYPTPDVAGMVLDFHEKYDCNINHNTRDNNELRRRLIMEEFDELMSSDNDENELKEMCDLVYVIVGSCISKGWDFNKAFTRVHRSNMSKTYGGKDRGGKVLKGPDYVKADLGDLV